MEARVPRPVVIAVLAAAAFGAGAAGVAILTGDGAEPRSSAAAVTAARTDAATPPATSAPAATEPSASTTAPPEATTTDATTADATTQAPAATTDASTEAAPLTEPTAATEPDDGAVPMPVVVRLQLDVAKTALDEVGIPYAVDGGGLFGVFDDAAWTVCSTDPEPGTTVEPGVTAVLRIARDCA